MKIKKSDLENSKKIQFNNSFLIGGSIFSENVDGGWNKLNSKSNWDLMFLSNRKRFFQNIGPKSFSGMLENSDEYINNIISSGVENINISLSWANLFPSENEVNVFVLEFYKTLFKKLKEKNISFIISFINFDIPLWFIEKEGFFKKENIKYVLSFIKFIIENFGEYFKLAYTFDDPFKMIIKSDILNKENPGNITSKQEYIDLITNIILFNSQIIKFIKDNNYNIKVGIKHSFIPFIFYGNKNINFNPNSKLYKYNVFINFGFLDFVIKGNSEEFNFLVENTLRLKIDLNDNELKLIRENTINFLGIKYNGICFITNKENDKPLEIFDEFLYFSNKDIDMDISYIDELSKIIIIKYNNIPNIFHTTFKFNDQEIFDKQNKSIDDVNRIEYISKTLSIINKNMKSNNLRTIGFFYENLFESWDYFHAFEFSNGLFARDNLKNIVFGKNSLFWFKRFCTNKHFFDFSIKSSISREVAIETKTKLLDFFND